MCYSRGGTMIYVFPHCAKYESEIAKIKGISRLFAYPCKPHFENKGNITILDSGAFGLYKAKKSIGDEYMSKLNKHYHQYGNNHNVICVAPDVAGDPMRTMRNYQRWQKNGYYPSIAPVLQWDNKVSSINMLKYQIDFYSNISNCKTILFPTALDGKTSRAIGLQSIFTYCKEKGFDWLHILGAGWNIEDIKHWNSLQDIDSIDSIAYYNVYSPTAFGSLNPIKNIYKILEVLK